MEDLDFAMEDTLYLTHGIHPYPARFPPQLVRWAIEKYTDEGEVVLDPMMGSGTTLVECALKKRKGVGIDIDPLARLISIVKTTPIEKRLLSFLERSVADSLPKMKFDAYMDKGILLPGVNNLDIWFLPQVSVELALLKELISSLEDERLRNLCMVVLSSMIIAKDSVSNAKDIVQTRPHVAEKDKVPDVFDRFRRRLGQVANAVKGYTNRVRTDSLPRVIAADARDIPLGNGTMDLVVFSPPYINALNYPRSHKFSIWWLDGLLIPEGIDSYNRLQAHYIGTEKVPIEECNLRMNHKFGIRSLDGVIRNISKCSIKKAGVVHRFFSEMKQVLRECARVLRHDKRIVLVVGDNTICGVKVKTSDLLMNLVDGTLGSHLVVENKTTRKIDSSKRKFPTQRGNRSRGIKKETVIVLRRRSPHHVGRIFRIC